MNRVNTIVQVLKILQEKMPRKDPKELMDLAYEIVMAINPPRTKITEKKIYDTGDRSGT
jgi:hypothetical protein